MNILIVDGNEKEASDTYRKIGMKTQYEVYSDILYKLSKNSLNLQIIHPAINENFIPKGLNLDDFKGIVWTGSLLNIYDSTKSIKRQIDLAKELLNKKNKIFGSCWGLHVLVTAAGGKVRKNPNGLEAIVAKDIVLNNKGINHPMYSGKRKIFDSFCWHYDEAEVLPQNTDVLAKNEKSKIQSISFKNKNSLVWAVQYHPEFNSSWMSGLMSQRENILLNEGVFNSREEFNFIKNLLDNNKINKKKENNINISDHLLNEKIHSLELLNWLNFLS